MTVTAEELALHFDGLSDEALLDKWRARTLTELAQSVADAEVRKRGLDTTLPAQGAPEAISASEALVEAPSDLETVFRTYNSLEAHALLGRLQADGIPASIADVQTNNQLPITIGGVRLQVPSEHAARARDVVADFRTGKLALPDEDAPSPEAGAHMDRNPALWNPDIAALLSWIVFTSIFGALIHAANWGRLGESDRATNSILWALAALFSFLLVDVYAVTQHIAQAPLLVFAHIVNTLAWYFVSGRKQSRYVVAVLKNKYERREWFTLVCFAVIVLACALAILR